MKRLVITREHGLYAISSDRVSVRGQSLENTLLAAGRASGFFDAAELEEDTPHQVRSNYEMAELFDHLLGPEPAEGSGRTNTVNQ